MRIGPFVMLCVIISPTLQAEDISLARDSWQHVTFGSKIHATEYTHSDHELTMTVKASASFLIQAFDFPKSISGATFEWKSDGLLKDQDAAKEKTKAGDDQRVRIGLPISGEPSFVPFDWLLPAWIRLVKGALKQKSNKLLYLVPDAKSLPETRWESPHHSSIEYLVIPSEPLKDGWTRSSFKTETPLSVVGLWVMADGDDSKSSFVTTLRGLQLEIASP